MKKHLPILLTSIVLLAVSYVVIVQKGRVSDKKDISIHNIGTFTKQKSCVKLPKFLTSMKISHPVMIDLSQKVSKGIALLYGKEYTKILHPKQWEQFGHMGTYSLDKQGNIYLVPMPFISIYPTTFNLQKNIYKIDTSTGRLSIFMHLDDVHPSANNPYGINAIVFDCDDNTLWISAIDESTYTKQKGVLYHIDIKSKTIIEKIKNVDALSLALLTSDKGKFLLFGSARDNGLYAYQLNKGPISHPIKIIELPNINEHIRKIKVKGKNRLELQSIPFSYTLIAQTSQNDRAYYDLLWHEVKNLWELKEK